MKISKQIWIHTICGGTMDLWGRKCLKCNRKWGIAEFLLDPRGIRPMLTTIDVKDKKRTYSQWADRIPYVSQFASYLPAWPRWARLLTFLGTLVIICSIIWFIWYRG